MINNKIFLFPIETRSLEFHYRLLKVSISGARAGVFDEKLINKTKKEVARKIWKLEKSISVEKWSVLIKVDGEPHIAIPADFTHHLPDIPFPSMNRTVSLQDTMKIHQFDFGKLEDSNEDLALGWLEDNIRIIMHRYSKQFWNLGRIYYLRQPENGDDPDREINVFKGFSLKIYRRGNSYALCVFDGVKYVDKCSLEWHLQKGENIKSVPPRHAIFKNGLNWYDIQVLDKTSSAIKDQIIPSFGMTVYKYLKEQSQIRNDFDINRVNPDSPAFEYQYPNNPNIKHFANSSWAYFTFSTNDPKVKHLHSLSIKDPGERLNAVHNFIHKFLANNSNFIIKPESQTIIRKWFPLPPLRFGRNYCLTAEKRNGKSDVKDWFPLKKKSLYEYGIYKMGDFLPQHLIVPSSMHQDVIDEFQKNLSKKIEAITGKPYRFSTIASYPIPDGPPSLSRYYSAIKQTLDKHNLLSDRDVTIVLVLPKNSPSKLHDHLKTLFKDGIRSQFLVESYSGNDNKLGISDFFERCLNQEASFRLQRRLENRFNSHVFYIALGVLLANRKWLYLLDKELHYDITIGMDVSNRKVGMTLYDGIHGELIFQFDLNSKPIRGDSYRREKLPQKIMENMILKLLNDSISILKLKSRSILIQRDGKAYDSEWIGLKNAIDTLQKNGLIDRKVNFGIVEVYKKSVSMPRMVTLIDGKVKNPLIGSYEFINNDEAILINTGFPANISGTAKPLLVRRKFGNVDFKYALQDIFDLSNLCYAAPDKPQRLPITLKLIDDFLTPIAYDIDSPGYDEEEEELETDDIYYANIQANITGG